MRCHPTELKQTSVNFTYYVSIRHFGPYEAVNETWSRLIQFAFDQGIAGKNITAFGICYDNPAWTVADQIRYDACLSISQDNFNEVGQRLQTDTNLSAPAEPECLGLRVETMKPCKTVMITHRGDYKHIRSTYADLASAPALRGLLAYSKEYPSIEIYRNNPLLTRPENLITEIHLQTP